MAEWSIASVLKTEVRKRTGGSNPSLSAPRCSNDYCAAAQFSNPGSASKNIARTASVTIVRAKSVAQHVALYKGRARSRASVSVSEGLFGFDSR